MIGQPVSLAVLPSKRGPPKKRGSYNCGRCGLPKKGHVCPAPDAPPRSDPRVRRPLSYDEDAEAEPEEVALPPVAMKMEEDGPMEEGEMLVPLPAVCLAEVLRRLPPKELMRAAAVCRGWRECVRRVWMSAEELRLRVLPRSQIGFVGSVLHKCSGVSRLMLMMESDVDATVLACVAFSCPNLEAFEINSADSAINRITGEDLRHFVAERRCLSTLKVEGCSNLGFLDLFSSSLSTLWLSDLNCMSKMAINCPNLRELSLDFTRQENDTTDLLSMMDCLVRTCSRLKNLHIASAKLSHEAVLALTSTSSRSLRMLSLVFGSKINDASVMSIVSCYPNLELLDLSGSNISDNGIRTICSALSQTLSRLLLALCPNITSSGIQFATTRLPHLRLIDCGMSIRDLSSDNDDVENSGMPCYGENRELRPNRKSSPNAHPIYQKLIVQHERLKKLSLWGCSGLDALDLICPELNDLNLTSCTNLCPEGLQLQCPNLENIHASGCHEMLLAAIQNRVFNKFTVEENHQPCKRLGDGSKRVQAPQFILQQPTDEKHKRPRLPRYNMHVN